MPYNFNDAVNPFDSQDSSRPVEATGEHDFGGAVNPFEDAVNPFEEKSGLVDHVVAGANELSAAEGTQEALKRADEIAKPGLKSLSWGGSGGQLFARPEVERRLQAQSKEGRDALTVDLQTKLNENRLLSEDAERVQYSDTTKTFLSNPDPEASIWDDFMADPFTIIAEIGARSAVNMVPSVAGGVVGAVATGGNPVGFGAGMGLASARTEYVHSVMSGLQEEGVDVFDAKQLVTAVANGELMDKVRTNAELRGGAIGAVDAVTGGVAGKTFGLGLKSVAGREAANLVTQAGIQSAGGAGGEALAQLATEGDITDTRALAAEAVGELVSAPVDVVSAGLSGVRQHQANKANDTSKGDALDALTEQMEGIVAPGRQHIEQPLQLEQDNVIYGEEPADVRAAREQFEAGAEQREANNFSAMYGQEGEARIAPVEGELLQPGQVTDESQMLNAPEERLGLNFDSAPRIEDGETIYAGQDPQQRPERTFTPVDPVYDGVGENIAQRQADMSPALPQGDVNRTVDIDTVNQGRTGLQLPEAKPIKPTVEEIEAAAAVTNTKPSEAQIEAENYKKGRIQINGLNIAIENPKGSTRSGIDESGKAWTSTMTHHYGDIKGRKGADGDDVDVFIGDNPESTKTFVVDQVDPDTGKFDEHKVMMGFNSEGEAKSGYLANYESGWNGVGAITEVHENEFKAWLKQGDTTKPFGNVGTVPQELSVEDRAMARQKKASTQAKARYHREPNPDTDDLMLAIALGGGLDRATAEAEGVDPAHFKERAKGRYPFRKAGGKSFDEMHEYLSQFGYVQSVEELHDKLFRSLAGEEVLTPDAQVARLEAMEDDQLIEEALASGNDKAVELASEYILKDKGDGFDSAYLDTVVAEALNNGVPEQELQAILDSSESITDAVFEIGAKLNESGQQGDHRESQEYTSEEEIPFTTEAGSEAGSLSPEEVFGRESEPDFELGAYTEQDLTKQAEAKAKADADTTAKEKAAQDKAQADSEVNDFTLSGSDRTADIAASRGQNDIFGASLPNTKPVENEPNEVELKLIGDARVALAGKRAAGRLNGGNPLAAQAADAANDAWLKVLTGSHTLDEALAELEKKNGLTSDVLKDVLDQLRSKAEPAEASQSETATFDDTLNSFNNAKDAIEWLSNNAEAADYQLIAERIKGLISDEVELVVVSNGVDVPGGVPNAMYGSKGVHYRTDARETIFLKDSTFDSSADQETLLHELIHAATLNAITEGNKVKNQGSPVSGAVQDLYKLQQEIMTEINRRYNAGEQTDTEKKNTFQSAMGSPHELIAWGLTSPEMQTYLKGVKLKGKKSAWSKFVSTVAKLIGVSSRQHNALSRLLEVSDNLFSAIEGKTTDQPKESGRAETATAPPKAKEAQAKSATKIGDFGEKLEGARKHTYSFTQAIGKDIDVKSVPLSKSFPQPDYEKLAAAGVDHRVLAFVAQLRAELKAKPRAKYKVSRWAETVESARSTSFALMDGAISPERLIEKLTENDRSSYLKNTPAIMDIAGEILPSQIKDLGSYKIEKHHYSIFRGEKDVNKVVVTDTAKKGGFGGMGNQQHFDTLSEAKAYIKGQVTTVSDTGKPMAKFDIWTERGKDGYFIGKKLAARKYIELHKVSTGAAAREYVQQHNEELVELLKKKKEVRSIRRTENNARVGKDYRQGVDVTQDLFAATFGFRGVQFGNWVENDKRQSDLNSAYDGLMDLADLIGAPPLALSLDGQLGLAFGARGKGGKNPASAHFEPGSVVINMTKKNGAGSLAHEWFHAVDNYFGRIDNPKAKEAHMTAATRQGYITKMVDGKATVVKAESSDFAVRQEVFDAFKALKKTIEQETEMVKRSVSLDSRRTKDYWSTVHEMTARSFERYVVGKLNDQGFESDYLANIVSEEEHNKINEILGDDEAYGYPLNSEMEAVNSAYDNLFDTIETKETESGVAMFSRAAASDIGFSIDHEAGAVLSDDAVRVATARIAKRMRIRGAKLNVVSTEADLPAAIQEQIIEHGAQGQIKAVLHGKTIHIVADKMESVTQVEEAVLHEGSHYGGRILFGKGMNQAYQKLWMKLGGVSGLRTKAKQYGFNMEPYFQTADDLLQKGEMNTAERAEFLIDEFLAHANGQKAYDSLPTRIKKAVQEFIGAIRDLLRKSGFAELPKLSDADIAYLLKKIRKSVSDNPEQADKPSFMRITDLDEQNIFLNNLADELEIEEQVAMLRQEQPAFSRRSPVTEQFNDLNADQESFLGKIAPRTTTQRIKDRVSEVMDRAGLKFRQGVVDRYAALFELDKQVYGDEVIEDHTAFSSWVLAKMSHAADGALSAMMSFGRIRMNEGVVELQDGQENSEGLMGVLQQLGSSAEIERFFGWIAANRSQKLAAEGRENLFTEEEIAAGINLNEGTTKEGHDRATMYNAVFEEFQQYRDDVLAIAEETGIIAEETRAMWKDEFYVPFYRVMEDEDPKGPRISGGLSRQEAYKKLKGGNQELNDLLENTLLNFQHLLSASLKNNAARQAMKNAEQVGVAEPTTESARDKKNSTFVLNDGQKDWYNINDSLVFEALTSLNDPGTGSASRKIMRGFKRIFTSFTTSSPQFMVANGIRDTLHAMAIGNLSYNGFKNFAGGFKEYGSPVHKGRVKGDMLASGAAFSFGHVYGTGDADALHAELERKLKGAKVIESVADVPGMMRKAWDYYSGFGDAFENANRASMFNQNQEKGKLYAAFQARDLMDFSSHGAWPAVRFLVDTVPFLNARIQGLDRMYRGGVKPSFNAIRHIMGGTEANMTDLEAAKRFAIVVGAMTAASIALYLHNKDDEEFQELEDWQRDMYWFVRIGDNKFFIPKPFEVGAIATLAERGVEQMADDTKHGDLFMERMGHIVMDTFSFNPTPQMVKPALDMYANKDSFTGRPIESMGMDRLSKVNRTRASTTEGAKAISHLLDKTTGKISDSLVISPIQADYLIQGYLGWIGSMGASAVDVMAKTAQGHESPAKEWHEYQPIRRFYKDGSNPGYTRYGTEFYKVLREVNRTYSDITHLRKLGEMEAAAELLTESRSKLRARKMLNKAQRMLSQLGTRSKLIQANSRLTGEEKRRQLDVIQIRRNEIQKRIVNRVESMQ